MSADVATLRDMGFALADEVIEQALEAAGGDVALAAEFLCSVQAEEADKPATAQAQDASPQEAGTGSAPAAPIKRLTCRHIFSRLLECDKLGTASFDLLFPCCGETYTCIQCHASKATAKKCKDFRDGSKLSMVCLSCSTVQKPSTTCAHTDCGKTLAKYFCGSCMVWAVTKSTARHVHHDTETNRCVYSLVPPGQKRPSRKDMGVKDTHSADGSVGLGTVFTTTPCGQQVLVNVGKRPVLCACAKADGLGSIGDSTGVLSNSTLVAVLQRCLKDSKAPRPATDDDGPYVPRVISKVVNTAYCAAFPCAPRPSKGVLIAESGVANKGLFLSFGEDEDSEGNPAIVSVRCGGWISLLRLSPHDTAAATTTLNCVPIGALFEMEGATFVMMSFVGKSDAVAYAIADDALTRLSVDAQVSYTDSDKLAARTIRNVSIPAQAHPIMAQGHVAVFSPRRFAYVCEHCFYTPATSNACAQCGCASMKTHASGVTFPVGTEVLFALASPPTSISGSAFGRGVIVAQTETDGSGRTYSVCTGATDGPVTTSIPEERVLTFTPRWLRWYEQLGGNVGNLPVPVLSEQGSVSKRCVLAPCNGKADASPEADTLRRVASALHITWLGVATVDHNIGALICPRVSAPSDDASAPCDVVLATDHDILTVKCQPTETATTLAAATYPAVHFGINAITTLAHALDGTIPPLVKAPRPGRKTCLVLQIPAPCDTVLGFLCLRTAMLLRRVSKSTRHIVDRMYRQPAHMMRTTGVEHNEAIVLDTRTRSVDLKTFSSFGEWLKTCAAAAPKLTVPVKDGVAESKAVDDAIAHGESLGDVAEPGEFINATLLFLRQRREELQRKHAPSVLFDAPGTMSSAWKLCGRTLRSIDVHATRSGCANTFALAEIFPALEHFTLTFPKDFRASAKSPEILSSPKSLHTFTLKIEVEAPPCVTLITNSLDLSAPNIRPKHLRVFSLSHEAIVKVFKGMSRARELLSEVRTFHGESEKVCKAPAVMSDVIAMIPNLEQLRWAHHNAQHPRDVRDVPQCNCWGPALAALTQKDDALAFDPARLTAIILPNCLISHAPLTPRLHSLAATMTISSFVDDASKLRPEWKAVFSKLTLLHIRINTFVEGKESDLVAAIEAMPRLESLRIDQDESSRGFPLCVSDATIECIALHCPRLEKLTVEGCDCTGVTDSGIHALALGCSQGLLSVRIQGTSCTSLADSVVRSYVSPLTDVSLH